jgi:predicted HicB family RNase H-like nuclease
MSATRPKRYTARIELRVSPALRAAAEAEAAARQQPVGEFVRGVLAKALNDHARE